MNDLILSVLPPTPPEIAEKIRNATEKIKPSEHTFQAQMEHVLHAGTYARTARVGAGMAFTSVLIRIPTLVIVHGHCCVVSGDKWRMLDGYNVLQAAAGRIQAYVTLGETEITMIFATEATTIEQAEAEFTDEADGLLSRRQGGKSCLE
jgi:hypothetical protein